MMYRILIKKIKIKVGGNSLLQYLTKTQFKTSRKPIPTHKLYFSDSQRITIFYIYLLSAYIVYFSNLSKYKQSFYQCLFSSLQHFANLVYLLFAFFHRLH